MSDHAPMEPSGPSSPRATSSMRWVGGWLLVTALGLVALAIAWAGGAGVTALGSLGLMVAIGASVPVYHVIVTQDGGERSAPRPDTTGDDLPARLERRHVVVASVVALGVGLVALLGLRRFAPVGPEGSAWQAGSHLVTIEGRRLRPDDVPIGGVVTVWPEGFEGTERAAVMVLRLRDRPEPPTRMDGVVDDTLVAYSRLCTHAGCAVALYRDLDQALFCPCHQATFDARRGARPTAGPASVPLPQLPLTLSDAGHLIATGDLSARPGPVGGQM